MGRKICSFTECFWTDDFAVCHMLLVAFKIRKFTIISSPHRMFSSEVQSWAPKAVCGPVNEARH